MKSCLVSHYELGLEIWRQWRWHIGACASRKRVRNIIIYCDAELNFAIFDLIRDARAKRCRRAWPFCSFFRRALVDFLFLGFHFWSYLSEKSKGRQALKSDIVSHGHHEYGVKIPDQKSQHWAVHGWIADLPLGWNLGVGPAYLLANIYLVYSTCHQLRKKKK